MKTSLKIKVLILCYLLASSLFANCKDVLRLEVLKRLDKDNFLFSSEIQKIYQLRDEQLKRNFSLFGNKESMLNKKRSSSTARFNKLLASKELDPELKQILLIIRDNIHSKDKIQQWAIVHDPHLI